MERKADEGRNKKEEIDKQRRKEIGQRYYKNVPSLKKGRPSNGNERTEEWRRDRKRTKREAEWVWERGRERRRKKKTSLRQRERDRENR